MAQMIRDWIWACKDQTGDLPSQIPDEEDGGSKAIFAPKPEPSADDGEDEKAGKKGNTGQVLSLSPFQR